MAHRRAALQSLCVFALAACGGGRGGDDASPPTGSPAPATPPPSGTPPAPPPPATGRHPDVCPEAGTFGGGEGAILFVSQDVSPESVKRIDLATRAISVVATPLPGPLTFIRGGVTRAAAAGRFAVLVDTRSRGFADVLVYERDGAQVARLSSGAPGHMHREGAAISPDGQHVALVSVSITLPNDDYLRVHVVDVATGVIHDIDVLSAPTLDDPSPTLAWTPDGTLLVLTNRALFRVDHVARSVTRLHDLDLAAPAHAFATADATQLWFHQSRGNPDGGTIWSLDITSGALTRRSIRSSGWGQHAPVISPDGQWLLAQEGVTFVGGSVASVDYYMTAIRITDPPLDVADLADEVLDASGQRFTAMHRMAWY